MFYVELMFIAALYTLHCSTAKGVHACTVTLAVRVDSSPFCLLFPTPFGHRQNPRGLQLKPCELELLGLHESCPCPAKVAPSVLINPLGVRYQTVGLVTELQVITSSR